MSLDSIYSIKVDYIVFFFFFILCVVGGGGLEEFHGNQKF